MDEDGYRKIIKKEGFYIEQVVDVVDRNLLQMDGIK